MTRQRAMEFVKRGLESLASDMKTTLRLVEDPDLDDASRVAAAGAVLHVLSHQNAIPGLRGTLAYVDDVLVLRLVLEGIKKRSPEALAVHENAAPELFETLDDDLVTIREYLGDLVSVLEKAANDVGRLSREGHSAKECAFDMEHTTWLYDEVQEAIVSGLDMGAEEAQRTSKLIDQILPPLKLKKSGRPS